MVSLLAMQPLHAHEGVILLHGLARSSRSLLPMERALSEAGYTVVNVNYPSRKQEIATLAEQYIGQAVAEAQQAGCTRVHFVTHSMGGLLVRYYLANHEIAVLGRVVMLGPPNQGSELIDHARHWKLFKAITGPAGPEMGTDKDSLPTTLGPVNFELGVIAGDRSINWINSLFIPGPDDGKVSVERTKIAGMRTHVLVHTTHPMMMRNRRVIEFVRTFLRTGGFEN